jgi:hypothetical protein
VSQFWGEVQKRLPHVESQWVSSKVGQALIDFPPNVRHNDEAGLTVR